MKAKPRKRYGWPADTDTRIALCDRGWEGIYDDVARAFVTNDELWSYAAELEEGHFE